jgi:hypothetical protein
MKYLNCLPDGDVSQVSAHLKSLQSSGGGEDGDDGGGGAVDIALLLGAALLGLVRVVRPLRTRHPQGWIE